MWLRLAIFLIAAAALAYEILLTRLLAIVQWHHFASLVISVALLGYGASGTLLSLARAALVRRFELAFLTAALAFAVSAPGCFAAAQRLPFNPLEIVWTGRQLGYLALLQLLLALPFFCAATCVGLALARFRRQIPRIYRADLLGAGCGAALVVLALWHRRPGECLLLVAAVPLLAAAAFCLDGRLRVRRRTGVIFAASGLLVLVAPWGGVEPRPSEYKGLAKALQLPGSRILLERSSPLGLLSVVSSPRIPFRHAPGLSPMFPGELPEQLGLFTDGDAMTAINRWSGRPGELEYLEHVPSALAYRLLSRPRVVVLGAGGGAEVLSALHHGASQVLVVEPNPQIVELLLTDFRQLSGDPYRHPAVRLEPADARGFFARARDRFDLIQIAYQDSSGGGAGGYSLGESYLYTVESFEEYLGHLSDGGLLAVTRWLRLPPRDSLKLLATAVEALGRAGVARPDESLALVRSWDSVVLLVKRGGLSPAEIATLRRFAEERSFDLAYYPGMEASEGNRFNILDRPYFFDGALSVLGPQRRQFFDSYKFDVEPATDDRPYFLHFFKWKAFPELYRLRAQGGPGLIEWGYVLLVGALVEAGLAGLVLILLPLLLLRRRAGAVRERRWPAVRIGLYFLSLGLGFLFVEIAFIQRFVLFLGHPVYAVAVVLAAFLVFAGLGSGRSEGWARWWSRRELAVGAWRPSPIELAALGVAAIGLLYLVALSPLLSRWAGWALPAKVGVSLALIAPPAFLMGMPFPLGLQTVGSLGREWIPWAWGVNGWASVLSALLASLLAIHFGFSAVVAAACALYVGAALAIRGVAARVETWEGGPRATGRDTG